MRKNTKMKKRLLALCLALTAFLAMPLTVGAAFLSTSEEMGGYGMYGTVNIEETHANAATGCQNIMAYMTVYLEYYFTNEASETIEKLYASGSSSTLIHKPNSAYRSYKAVSKHHVSFGDYQWNPASISIYY